MPLPLRSYLYVPANDTDKVGKALASDADAIVLDLEDAVALDDKDVARDTAAAVLAASPVKPTYVRVNAADTGRMMEDAAAVAGAGLAGIRLPKAEDPAVVSKVARLLADANCAAPLHLLLESALGLERGYALATAAPTVRAIALGEADLAADLGSSDPMTMDAARTRCVATARAAGLAAPVQSAHGRIGDRDGLLTSCLRGKQLGYFGRSAIHPGQIDVINEAYLPTEAEVRAATELLESLGSGERAVAVTRDGRFVDPAVTRLARRVLSIAASYGCRDDRVDPRKPLLRKGVLR
ncbi:MAG: CoA ester lyase [Kutzneria sp.]|nr:CoA ester lyase [Kutzneria sp.]MBV9847238.1 CoA ester lyase [Kutzneria sp.]